MKVTATMSYENELKVPYICKGCGHIGINEYNYLSTEEETLFARGYVEECEKCGYKTGVQIVSIVFKQED